MNVEDQITYIILKNLDHKPKEKLNLYQKAVQKAEQVAPSSNHIVADTLRLIDWQHNQFLNCVINLKHQIKPVPNLHSGLAHNQNWITPVGELELKRLENDYQN